jgi:hypothetical protein
VARVVERLVLEARLTVIGDCGAVIRWQLQTRRVLES